MRSLKRMAWDGLGAIGWFAMTAYAVGWFIGRSERNRLASEALRRDT